MPRCRVKIATTQTPAGRATPPYAAASQKAGPRIWAADQITHHVQRLGVADGPGSDRPVLQAR